MAIERKRKLCKVCNREDYIFGKNMCKSCYREDYAKKYRAKQTQKNLFQKGPQLPQQKKAVLSSLKNNIKTSSTTNTYQDSQGNRFTKKEIERKVAQAKKEYNEWFLNEYGYIYCVDCKKEFEEYGTMPEDTMEYKIIDNSHTISVDEAQKTGRTELAWDWKDEPGKPGNIKKRCRHHHRLLDKLY